MRRNLYYIKIKPVIPRRLQIFLRRKIVLLKQLKYSNTWPIDEKSNKLPNGWNGWPDGKQFALVLTHDVEKAEGYEKCYELMYLEKQIGFRSSFNFVAKRYKVTSDLRHYLIDNGFEVGLHGLNHDMSLYKSKKAFLKQAIQINQYLREWGCAGFRAPSMIHNLEWNHYLDIEYDASTFDTDPFEPQPDGIGTIFPFFVQGDPGKKGYVELPYTLPQDHTLFIIMRKKNIDIWKKKLDWIVNNGGMVLMITHPDYMNFGRKKLGFEEYPSQYYEEFLTSIKTQYEGQYWHVLPKDIARFWAKNFKENSINKTPSNM